MGDKLLLVGRHHAPLPFMGDSYSTEARPSGLGPVTQIEVCKMRHPDGHDISGRQFREEMPPPTKPHVKGLTYSEMRILEEMRDAYIKECSENQSRWRKAADYHEIFRKLQYKKRRATQVVNYLLEGDTAVPLPEDYGDWPGI